jgi:hypothetical protein
MPRARMGACSEDNVSAKIFGGHHFVPSPPAWQLRSRCSFCLLRRDAQ